MKIKRVYRHYKLCEEYASGMWKVVDSSERDRQAKLALELLSNPEEFEKAGFRLIEEWPFSCEVTFTAKTLNHQSWLGQAACALIHGCAEDATRQGWKSLTKDQQEAANAVADKVKNIWLERYTRV